MNGPEAIIHPAKACTGTPVDSTDMLIPRVPAITARTFGGFLALLIFAAFPLGVLGLKIPLFRDFGLYSYPIAHYLREAFRRGEIPLWNPLSFCGIPFLAQWNTMVLYPLSILYVLLPLAQGLTWFCLLHVWIAGLGMFYLARERTGSAMAGALAGVAYAFNGIAMDTGLWPCTIVPLAWAPWVLWTVPRYVKLSTRDTQPPRTARAFLAATASGVLLMLSPFPEIIFMTLLFLGLLLLVDLWPRTNFGKLQAETQLGHPDQQNAIGRMLGRLALWAMLTLGISAAQLLPFFDLLLASQRGEDPTRFIWSMPPTGWANLLIPLYLCIPAHHGIYFQPEQSFVASYYMGIPTVVLALLSVVRLRRRDMWISFGLAFFALVMALGNATPLYDAVNRLVPPLRLMRFSIKYVFLLALTLPLAAAGFAARFEERFPVKRAKLRADVRIFGFAAVAFIALIAALLLFLRSFPAAAPFRRVVIINAAHRITFLVLFAGAVAMLSRADQRPRQLFWQWIPVILLAADLLTHKPVRTPWVDSWVLKPGIINEHIGFTEMPRHGSSRVMFRPGDEIRFGQFVAGGPNEEYLGQRLAMSFNCNLLDDIPKVTGFFPLKPAPIYRVQRLFLEKPDDLLSPLADFLSVSHVNAAGRFYEWVARPTYLPMLTTPGRVVFASSEHTLAALKSHDFDARGEVYLPEQAAGFVASNFTGQATILRQHFHAHQNRVEIESTNEMLLVLNQTFYHHWRAYVDGQPTHIWPANHAFQAVLVPEGRHVVEWRYEDRVFRLGGTISIISLLVLALITVRGRAGNTPPVAHKTSMQSP